MFSYLLQGLPEISIPWGNPYVQLIVTGIIAGLVVAYIVYRLDWNSDDSNLDNSNGVRSESNPSQDVSQDVDQTVNVYPRDQSSENETEEEAADGGEESEQPEINCYPRNLEKGGIDIVSEGENEIPTFNNQAEAKVRVKWPEDREPGWVLVEGGEGVFINFKDEPPGMRFEGKKFMVGRNSKVESFEIEISAPRVAGQRDLTFTDVSLGEVVHSELLVGLN